VIFTLDPLAKGPATKSLAESLMKILGVASQLAVAIRVKNPLGFDPPASRAGVCPAGFGPGRTLTTGTTLLLTVTLAMQEFDAPLLSVTVSVTVVIPSG
jgi:hypothetical protein